jgi:hypothetical protein
MAHVTEIYDHDGPGEHEAQPHPRTIRSVRDGREGRKTDGLDAMLYPLEGLCLTCGAPVRIQNYFLGNWIHLPRTEARAG